MTTRVKRRGFTLVELLVVIAIISVLAAILLPVLQGSIAIARQTDCMNRLKQVYMAASAYEEDCGTQPLDMGAKYDNWATWNRYIHGGRITSSSSYTGAPVDYTTSSYVPRAVFLCPIHLALNPNIDSWTTRSSYRLNGHYLPQPIAIRKIRKPSQVFLSGDSGHTSYGSIFKRTTANSVSDWHDGKTNMLYFDGHVQSWVFEMVPFHETWWTPATPWEDS